MKWMRKMIAGMLSMSLSMTVLTGMPSNIYDNGIKAKAGGAVQADRMTVLETNVEAASEGCTMLGVYGSYYSQAQDALDRINEIRKEACDAGNVPYPGNPSRMLEASDYIPIQWSKDLESIARIRAMEGGLAFSFLSSGHSRLNGEEIWSVQYNGVRSYAEDLAYNWGTSMVSGINQWYREKDDWVNQVKGAVTGHYTSMIDPEFAYVGLGDFYTEEAKYPNTLAGAFCGGFQSLDQSMQTAQENVMQKIEVKDSYIEGYALEGDSTVSIGGTTGLILRVNLVNGSQKLKLWAIDPVEYSSSDVSVAQVADDGTVTGQSAGMATISAKSGNGELASISITVKPSEEAEASQAPDTTTTKRPLAKPTPSASLVPSAKPTPSASLIPSAAPTQRPTETPAASAKPSQSPAPVQTEDIGNPDAGYEKPSGINVRYHTQEEIRAYARKSNVSLNDALEFAEEPVIQSPYSLGKLSDRTLQSALKMLNQVRYIAGISDNVELSDEYNTLCQAGVLANYANAQLSHYPEKPDGMSDDIYALAKEGAGSSNLAWGGRSLNGTIVSSWMEDGDDSNIDRTGHRRWLLNPVMGKTGFGAISGEYGTCSSVYVFDSSNSFAGEYGVAWPAQNMPVEYFGESFPWSVSMGYSVNKDNVKVTLTRKNDGKTWDFSSFSSDGAFYVNNVGYGQKGCIIFRPEKGIQYRAGDIFKVEITGLNEDVSYTVNFFQLKPSSDTDTNTGTDSDSSNGVDSDANTGTDSDSSNGTDSDSSNGTDFDANTGTDSDSSNGTDFDSSNGTDFDNSSGADSGSSNKTDVIEVDTKITDKKSKAVYKVTGTGKYKSVAYLKSKKKSPVSVTVPDSVKINGKKYKVLSIEKNALKNCRKLQSVTIGKNVVLIGANAFSGCKKLRNITVRTNKLTAASIGRNAFKKGYSKPRVNAGRNKCKLYKRIFISNGMSKKCKFAAL